MYFMVKYKRFVLTVTTALICSGLCAMAVCRVHGRTGLCSPAPHVQSAEDRGDLILQHEPHPAAVVTNLAGHWRSFQQGLWPKAFGIWIKSHNLEFHKDFKMSISQRQCYCFTLDKRQWQFLPVNFSWMWLHLNPSCILMAILVIFIGIFVIISSVFMQTAHI